MRPGAASCRPTSVAVALSEAVVARRTRGVSGLTAACAATSTATACAVARSGHGPHAAGGHGAAGSMTASASIPLKEGWVGGRKGCVRCGRRGGYPRDEVIAWMCEFLNVCTNSQTHVGCVLQLCRPGSAKHANFIVCDVRAVLSKPSHTRNIGTMNKHCASLAALQGPSMHVHTCMQCMTICMARHIHIHTKLGGWQQGQLTTLQVQLYVP